MRIFGPLTPPSTSAVTVTPAIASAPVVTVSPSTTMTAGRVSVSPGVVSSWSIAMTSPTETFSWRPPLRTIAYTGLPSTELAGRAPVAASGHAGGGARSAEGQAYGAVAGPVKLP